MKPKPEDGLTVTLLHQRSNRRPISTYDTITIFLEGQGNLLREFSLRLKKKLPVTQICYLSLQCRLYLDLKPRKKHEKMSLWISEEVFMYVWAQWLSVRHLVLYRRRRTRIYLPWGRWAPVSTAHRTGKAGHWVKRWLSDRNPTPRSHWAAQAGPTGLRTEEEESVRAPVQLGNLRL